MLQSMRERTQGIIAGVIVALICLTFALWGIQNYLHGSEATDVIAKVNGVKITQMEFKNAYERARQQMVAQSGKQFALDQDAQQQFKKEVLQKIIQDQVLLQEAKNLGFAVGDQQLQITITQLPIFQVSGKFSYERYQQLLNNMLYSEDGFFKEMRNVLLLAQLSSGIQSSAFVLPGEVETALQLQQQKRAIGYFLLPSDHFFSQIKLTVGDIQDYYQKNHAEFMTPESVSIEYLQLSTDQLTNKLDAAPVDQLQQFYKDNIASYSQPMRWQLARILLKQAVNVSAKDIAANKSKLEQFAKKAQTDGDFSKLAPAQFTSMSVTHSEIPADLVQEVEKLKPGQISPPFQSKDGYNLVKVIGVIPAKSLPFVQVREKVQKAFVQQKMMQLFSAQNDKLADLTYTNSDSLEPAAKELGLAVQKTELFARSGGKSGLTADQKIVKAAFSDAVLNQGYNSNVIEISPGNVIVLRLKQHELSKARSLEEVRSLIEQRLKDIKARKMAEDLGIDLVKALQNKAVPAELAKRYNLVWQAAPVLDRQDAKLPPELVRAAFSLSKPSAATVVALSKGGIAVVFLDKILAADLKQVIAKQRQDLQNNLESKFGEYDYTTLRNTWLKNAAVEKFSANEGVAE